MSSSSVSSSIPIVTNRSSFLLSHESIVEARQRRRRRIQKQNLLQVRKVPSTGSTATTKTAATAAAMNPGTVSSNCTIPTSGRKSSLRARFPTTSTFTTTSKTQPPICPSMSTINSFDAVLDTSSSFALVVSDDDDYDDSNNKSTHSMIEKEIDSFILPIDYFSEYRTAVENTTTGRSLSSSVYYNNVHHDDDDDDCDPYLVPILSLQRRLLKTNDINIPQQRNVITEDDINIKNDSKEKENSVIDEKTIIQSPPPPPTKSGPLFKQSLNSAVPVVIDRRPISYISIPTPIRVNSEQSFNTTMVEVDDTNDSFLTIQGTDMLVPTQNQLQQRVQLQCHQQQPQSVVFVSHQNGNKYLHQNHDIESAKLWYEYAYDQSNINNNTESIPVDPLDRQHPIIRQQQQQHTSPTTGKTALHKQAENQLQQSLYRINRLQRWYYEENPDIDENLLFEL